MPSVGKPVDIRFLHEGSDKIVDTRATKTIVTKSGKQCQIEWRGTTLSDAAGKLVGYLNVGHDVTEQLEQEKALQKAEQEADRARNAKSRFLEATGNDLRHQLQILSLLNGALRRVVESPKRMKCSRFRVTRSRIWGGC